MISEDEVGRLNRGFIKSSEFTYKVEDKSKFRNQFLSFPKNDRKILHYIMSSNFRLSIDRTIWWIFTSVIPGAVKG